MAMVIKSENIAKVLFMSISTVKKTLGNTYLKLNAKNKANAVAIAILDNMIDINMLKHVYKKYKIDLDENNV